ncbi:MAG: methylated-DNA--[protein]-cysteine S-methyltransferase [Candidatus Bathyarchaeia archaeon]
MIDLCVKNLEGVWFGVACDEEKIFATTFASTDKKALHYLLKDIPFNVPFQHSEKASVFVESVVNLLKRIYDGEEVSHHFHLATENLSNYARNVIKTVALIPTGYVASYCSVAKTAGGSPRAVGRVMALNPFPLIVPCHRVVCSNFTLGGYGGGLDVKFEILRRENRSYTSEIEIQVNGRKLRLFPVGFVLNKLKKSKIGKYI